MKWPFWGAYRHTSFSDRPIYMDKIAVVFSVSRSYIVRCGEGLKMDENGIKKSLAHPAWQISPLTIWNWGEACSSCSMPDFRRSWPALQHPVGMPSRISQDTPSRPAFSIQPDFPSSRHRHRPSYAIIGHHRPS
jgi:hypothetical protein